MSPFAQIDRGINLRPLVLAPLTPTTPTAPTEAESVAKFVASKKAAAMRRRDEAAAERRAEEAQRVAAQEASEWEARRLENKRKYEELGQEGRDAARKRRFDSAQP